MAINEIDNAQIKIFEGTDLTPREVDMLKRHEFDKAVKAGVILL